MKNRMSRCAALIGTLLSLSSFAQVCNEVALYKGGETGRMESSTFPENPEWSTNWGKMGSLEPPYIRWSGMKNVSGDWKGSLVLNQLPTYVKGGDLHLDVRTTQNAKVGVWLEGDFGKSPMYYQDVAANSSKTITVPVASLVGANRVLLQKVGIGLINVPANQYTTLFADNIRLTCSVGTNPEASAGGSALQATADYIYSDVVPSNAARKSRFMRSAAPATSAAYDIAARDSLGATTGFSFLLTESEHLQVSRYVTSENLTAQQSRDGWFKVMYLIERNRLKDSVIANPKALFYEANAFAASSENEAMPILVGNVDYGYKVCGDTACGMARVMGARALVAGLPSASVNGSVLKLHYDPYFVTTNRASVPALEIYSGGKWNPVPEKSEFIVNFESAGLQKLKVRLSEGGLTVNQTLFVEVK